MKRLILNKGDLFTVTSGAYSDFMVHTLCVAKEDIHVDALLDEYLEIYPEQRKDCHFNEPKFLAFLNGKDLLEEVNHKELYLGYLSFEESHIADFEAAIKQ